MNKSKNHGMARAGYSFPSVALGMLVLCLAASPAQANSVAVSFNAGAATDYVFRGVSQTDENPLIFAGADISADGFYAGLWTGNVDYADGTDAEVDLYGGWGYEADGWSFNLGGIYYFYPGQPKGADYDYFEAKLAGSARLGPVTLGAALYYSPDFFGAEDEATYAEVNAAYSFAEAWTASGAAGHQSVSSNADYSTWNLGLSWAATDVVTFDLRYHDTDAHNLGVLYEDRLVASLKTVF